MEFCKFNTHFTGITALGSALLPNAFTVSVTFTVNEGDADMQNIAFNRIKHFIENELNFGILITKKNSLFKTLSKVQNKLVVLPDDGPDWALACALCLKLNAICEQKFTVNLVEMSSALGDNVTYYADWDRQELLRMVLSSISKTDNWWDDPEIAYNKYQQFATWEQVELSWNLTKKENSARVVKIIQFNPKVVKGGLETKSDQ